MKPKFALFLIIIFFLAQAVYFSGQFTPQEIAQREEIERFLKTAEIVNAEPIGEGVTRPMRLYLKKDGQEYSGCWKNPSGIQLGILEGWRYEIAAYRLDKLIGLNMVPPTVEREFKGKKGSLQFWADVEISLLKVMEKNIPVPSWAMDQTNKMKYVTRAWDSLIANEDRTQQNIQYTKDWRTILIDHSRAFRSSKEFAERLIFGINGIQKSKEDGRPFLFRQLPRAFVEKVNALDFASIKKAMGPYLNDKEINAILKRKALFLEEIDQMVKEQGEAGVLY